VGVFFSEHSVVLHKQRCSNQRITSRIPLAFAATVLSDPQYLVKELHQTGVVVNIRLQSDHHVGQSG